MKARVLILGMTCLIGACNGQVAKEGAQAGVTGSLAQIESSLLRPSFDECLDKAGGVTPDMQACIEKEFVFHDAKLQASYNELHALLPDEEEQEFEVSQRKWLAEREAACPWDEETEGQAQRLEANLCHLRSTAERAKFLEARLK